MNSTADPDDRFATQAPRAWSFDPQKQRFSVLRLHQQGGLGRLMIARDGELNREVALKEILPSYADDEASRGRFLREAEITGALEHPGIVPVYSLGEFADGRPYYAMRFIRGVDLRAALDDFHRAGERDNGKKRLEFRRLLGRFVNVCHAIHYAHTRGVVHRDIKPSNIMLGDFGETLVVDWGLARTFDEPVPRSEIQAPPISTSNRASSDHTEVGQIIGTMPYMSPEQASGRVDLASPASDIYGLGATLYHILTGVAPFEGNPDDTILRIQRGRFSRPRDIVKRVPRPLEAICLKAMALEPRDRYATARDLALDVERYLGDEKVSAYAEPAPARVWRWSRNHRTAVMSTMAAAAVAVATLSTGVVLLSAANRREREARDRATAAFQEANVERQRAERNFELAQRAVREYYVRVSEETLLNQLGMQPLRDDLLRQALEYYEQFLAERADDSQLRREVAQAQFFVGRITETIDSPAAALSHYQQAEELQARLVDANPEDAALGVAYGQTLNAWGRALQKLERIDQARQRYQQAAAIREKLAAAAPDDAELAGALANSIMNLGLLDLVAGEPAAALPLLERAQTLRRAHAESGPPRAASLRDLGMGFYNLAMARLALGDAAEAMIDLENAIDAFEKLAALEPQDFDNRRRMAICRRMIADIQAGAGQSDEAVESYEQARDALNDLVQRNPDVPEYAADLAGIEMNLGAELERQGDADAALDQMLAAVATLSRLVDDGSALPRHRRDLGVALRAAGELLSRLSRNDEARSRLEESRVVLQSLVREHPGDPSYAAELKLTLDALDALEAV